MSGKICDFLYKIANNSKISKGGVIAVKSKVVAQNSRIPEMYHLPIQIVQIQAKNSNKHVGGNTN